MPPQVSKGLKQKPTEEQNAQNDRESYDDYFY